MKQSSHAISMLIAKYKATLWRMFGGKAVGRTVKPAVAGLAAAFLLAACALSPAAIGISPAYAAAGDVYVLGGGGGGGVGGVGGGGGAGGYVGSSDPGGQGGSSSNGSVGGSGGNTGAGSGTSSAGGVGGSGILAGAGGGEGVNGQNGAYNLASGGVSNGAGGDGGGGGGADLVTANSSFGNVTVVGGGGGNGFVGGGGGAAAMIATHASVSVGNNVTVTGGKGGDNVDNASGYGSTRGYGGAAALDFSNNLSVGGSVTVTGGNGGNGNGGMWGSDGGAATMSVANRLTVGSTLTVASGADGTGGSYGGAGGAASFTAGTLAAPAITLTQNNGTLAFTVGTLDLSGTNTTLTLNNTAAWNGTSGVSLGSLVFAGGHGLSVTSTGGGTMTAGGNLSVSGTGNSYSSSVAYDASGRQLSFNLTSVAAGGTMLSVTGPAMNIAGSTVTLAGNAAGLHVGDTVTLIDSTTGTPASFSGNSVPAGLLTYNFALAATPGALQAYVASTQLNPQSKALSEGRMAALAYSNQGQALLAGQGMDNASDAASGNAPAGFFAMAGGHNRYQTGSHVDVNGFSLAAGIGKKNTLGNGTMLNGLFFETGWGNYSTYNSFAGLASIRGDGDTRYYGGGYLGRYQKTNGQYVEGSVRAGRTTSTFRSGDLNAVVGQSADYTVGAPYYGLHLGIGKKKPVGPNLTLDTYGKFFWSRLGGSNATVAGTPVHFDAVNSQRWRLGAKLTRKADERTTVRTGLAYQFEFGGKASASTLGYSIDAPSLKGGTGIVELGVTIAPKKGGNTPALDISLQGFVGKCQGITGSVQATWKY